MKTLTELGGSLIRTAAAAIAEARRSLPGEERPAEPPATEAAPQAAEVPQAADGSVADPAIETVAEAAPPAPPATVPKPEPEVESEAVKAALLDAVARATGLSGDRLVMLRAAVEAAGRRAEDVRLVRVFGIEEQLRGAQKIGEYQYVVDFLPRSMKQVAGGPDEHGRGGGARRR
jgi:translation initiation factor IF-2